MFTYIFLGAFHAQAQFTAPRIQAGSYMATPAVAFMDFTRDGSIDLFAPTVFGFGFAISLDEDAGVLGQGSQGWIPAPGYPAGSIPVPLTLGKGDFNGDEREDLVIVTSSGALLLANNAGGHRVSAAVFQPPTVVDFFGPSMVINPPFVSFSFPGIVTADVDGDQVLDILVAGSPVDSWTATTNPGFVTYYRGTGGGNFIPYTLPLPGNVIDMEWADLNSDGTKDHLVLVTEMGSMGAFGYDLHHVAFNSTNLLHFTTFPFNMTPRVTSLEVADISGTPHADYIFSTTVPGSGQIAQLFYHEGDGQNMTATWGPLGLPASTSALRESILSTRVDDFNKDGFADLAVLRSYCTPGAPFSTVATQYGDAEVHVFYGPNLPFASPTSMSVGGYVQDTWSPNYNAQFLPNRAMPDLLRSVDFGTDHVPDLFVTHVFGIPPTTTSTIPIFSTFKNSTAPLVGDPAFVKVGDPSGPGNDNRARAGFDGAAVIGNTNFKGTLSNVAPNSLAGYMWSSFGQANLFSALGFDFHIAPAEYGYLKVASGTGFASYDLPIPNNPALIGDVGYFQWNHWNPATGNFGGTQATQVIVGQ